MTYYVVCSQGIYTAVSATAVTTGHRTYAAAVTALLKLMGG